MLRNVPGDPMLALYKLVYEKGALFQGYRQTERHDAGNTTRRSIKPSVVQYDNEHIYQNLSDESQRSCIKLC